MTSNQLKILKYLIELLKGAFNKLPPLEINPYQDNLENMYTISTINWSWSNFWLMIGQKISTLLIFWKIANCMLLFEARHEEFFAEMVFQLKRSNEQELCSSQEEADTKMFLSESFVIFLGFESLFIATKDRDILALRPYYSQKFGRKLYIEMLINPRASLQLY